jgi:ligand-binding SRPBCC domain-containing protein
MPIIRVKLHIAAPIETCFDLARDIDLHQLSVAQSKERAIAGVTSGLVQLGDVVTWEATHFGIRQRLTARITAYRRPEYFVDELVRGAFARFTHLHRFVEDGNGSLMSDQFDYTSPLGPLGKLADMLFLERYMRRLLVGRNAVIKSVAEQSRRDKQQDGERD